MVKFGKAFSDSVSIFRRRRKSSNQRKLTGWGARFTLFYILFFGCFFLLAVRLFHLTVVKGQENRSISEENRIRTNIIHAPRGIFFDRLGKPLAENIPSFRVTKPCQVDVVCPTLFITQEQWKEKERSVESIYLERDYLRRYIYPYETAQLLGYLSEITQEELTNPFYSYQGYLPGDRIGRMGLEETEQKDLRGTDGKELIEVDANNQKVRTLGRIDELRGEDMWLAIDIELQKVAYAALGENPGAIIVSKPRTGEVLTLVSTPSFDPNKIHTGISQAEFKSLFESNDRPLVNRAVSQVYPPGSTFKPVVAIAGLESGSITKDTLVEDIGVLSIGRFSFSNWYFTQYGKKEGQVDLLKGIARSNDIYFYKIGESVGVTKIAEWGRNFGIGKKTGIELVGEAEGLMPDPEWRKKVRGQEWYLGDTYHVAIGQGELQTTPLQVNLWTNAIAGGGVLCKPTLLKVQSEKFKVQSCRDLQIKKETIELVTEGMRRACYRGPDVEYQGTGWPLFEFKVKSGSPQGEFKVESEQNKEASPPDNQIVTVPVACKTGTSEFGDPKGRTHAWFTAFAPLPEVYISGDTKNFITGEPEIVVTVLVEAGGEGSSVAGPIAKKIFEEWFRR